MAYEYNSQDKRFEFPNPYRIENIFKVIGAIVFMLAGLSLIFSAKGLFSNGVFVALPPLIVGLAMFSYGALLLTTGLSNLKFYFGRDQPAGLAQELSIQETGAYPGATDIKEILRQSALIYEEPKGSVNGILYSLFPNLIFSPLFIRNAAEAQFQNAIVFLITLVSALIAYVGASPNTGAWLGIVYNAIILIVLLRPMANPNSGAQEIGLSKVIGLVLVAILGPVLVPILTQHAVAPIWLPSMDKAIFTLIAALIAIAIFFLAVIAQMVKQPPQASAGVVQDSFCMNCQPMQIFDEHERHLQKNWESAIPNRIYSRQLPVINSRSKNGAFEGEILEETQPVPINTLRDMTLSSCFKEEKYRWLAILNSFGLLSFIASVVLMTIFAKGLYNGSYLDFSDFTYGFFGVSMWILGKFCFEHGNYLWSRFDFVSKLIWVEAKGSYQLSQMNFGRYLDDSVKSQKEVINVETMTLRVWYAEISTTTFGKYQNRAILSMTACTDDAVVLKEHLADFAKSQSIVVAPTSEVDINRMSSMNQMNSAINKSSPRTHGTHLGLMNNPETHSQDLSDQVPVIIKPKKNMFCVKCGEPLQDNMLFCPQCGTKIES
jgi:hypothetical protein